MFGSYCHDLSVVTTMTAEKRLIIIVLAELALTASGYLLIFLNPKFSLLGVATVFLAIFLILGLVAHATPRAGRNPKSLKSRPWRNPR